MPPLLFNEPAPAKKQARMIEEAGEEKRKAEEEASRCASLKLFYEAPGAQVGRRCPRAPGQDSAALARMDDASPRRAEDSAPYRPSYSPGVEK